MQPRFRQDYAGEFIILETTWSGGKRQEKREWIQNPIENQHISNRATCIGSSINKDLFDYTRLDKHRGGLLGSMKLQNYGTGTIAKQMRLDFSVESNSKVLQELVDTDYQEHNIVYTTARNCIANPGQFYLIPQHPKLSDLALPLYLASFDGHQEIFLIGYNNETPADDRRWIDQITDVIASYSGVKFYTLGEVTNIPTQWLDLSNTSHLSWRDFIGYCDI